ncbi:hypothetical protein EB796_000979 [Bugula neritina]|uniref:Uncharacterized protein n=1 Tax=Bugula neritina TaxID=10212 RepID=A0A7J7KRB4_BUGNE|nr:hypothetical protein EB796_000979 [Bugula neritina]
MGITVAEMTKHNMFADPDKSNLMNKAKQILAKKAMAVLQLLDAINSHSLKGGDLWELHFASQEFKKQKIPDKMNLLQKVEKAIYNLEETGKALLYQQVVPFLTRLLGDSNVAPQQLSAAIIAARIEFSRVGIEDPGELIKTAEKKLYDIIFSPLSEMLEYGKECQNAQDCVKQFGIVEADDLLLKADDKFMELAREEIEEAKIKRDPSGLKE